MYVRKIAFLEIFLPITVLAFLGQGTHFVDRTHIADFRFLFLGLMFAYLFLHRHVLLCVKNSIWLFLLILYLIWCISTSVWSEVPLLSFSKSGMFALTVVTLISAGSIWVLQFGFERSLNWLFFIVVVSLASGVFGYRGAVPTPATELVWNKALSTNPNNFGFLLSLSVPFILWKCYQVKDNKYTLLLWITCLIVNIYFLFSSYSRSSIATFFSILLFFTLSLPLSKKILTTFCSFFAVLIILLTIPMNSMETFVLQHLTKETEAQATSNVILASRQSKWEKSYRNAMKGGIMGVGFGATAGDQSVTIENYREYGREKGNAQLAIMEETGIVGLIFSSGLIIIFLMQIIPYYFRMQGTEKVTMGLVLGIIIGLLLESIVEGWWDSLGPEVICFWTLVGIAFGMVFLKKIQSHE